LKEGASKIAPLKGPGSSFRNSFSRATEIPRKILKFRQPVSHPQDLLRIVDMDLGREFQIRNRRRINVYQAKRRMVGHQVAAAFGAILSFALRRLGKGAKKLPTLSDLHVLWRPKGEGVDRACRPGAA